MASTRLPEFLDYRPPFGVPADGFNHPDKLYKAALEALASWRATARIHEQLFDRYVPHYDNSATKTLEIALRYQAAG